MLPNGLMVQWGNIPSSSNEDDGYWHTISFSPSFAAKPYFFRATKSTQNSHIQEVGYIRKGYMTANSVQFRNMPASDTFWIAIGAS